MNKLNDKMNVRLTAFSRISGHLDSLANEMFMLEEAVGHSLGGSSAALDENRVTELQSLDFLRQSLEDLALLMHFVDKHVPDVVQSAIPKMEVSDKLKLETTKSLLTGDTVARPRPGVSKATGEVDLF